MKFSIKTVLVAIAFVSIWLAAIVSRSPISLELAAMASILALFIALPLSFFDATVERRPFWAGFFSIGLGFFLMLYADLDIGKTSDSIANLLCSLPGANKFEDTQLTQTVPAYFVDSPGKTSAPLMQPVTTTFSLHMSIRNAVPFFLAYTFAIVGGTITYYMSLKTGISDAG